jgi:hypothetical protein
VVIKLVNVRRSNAMEIQVVLREPFAKRVVVYRVVLLINRALLTRNVIVVSAIK